jgi:predicted nucleic acid-binding protein
MAGLGYFLDTYALYEILAGNKKYEKYMGANVHTSILNIAELYYRILREFGEKEADEKTLPFTSFLLDMKPLTIKKAMIFRLKNRSKKLSYVDCIGYELARENRLYFLTGDKQFSSIPHVEYVK